MNPEQVPNLIRKTSTQALDKNRLSKTNQQALLDWLTNVLEHDLELADEFKSEIKRGEADIAAGRVRIVEPDFARRERLNRFFIDWDATHSVAVGEKPNRARTYSDDKAG